MTVQSQYGTGIKVFSNGDTSKLEHSSAVGSKWIGADSNSYWEMIHKGSIQGIVATITYNNLHHSFYVDKNGVKRPITKIVRQFSNLHAYPQSLTDSQPRPYWGNNTWLLVYNDPADGWWTGHTLDLTITDQYYDNQGNLINFDGNAYLSANSLNAVYWDGSSTSASLSGQREHVEYVTPLTGVTSYELAGSSVKKHNDGSLYATQTNSSVGYDIIKKTSQTTWKGEQNWDNHSSKDFYYGSGILALSGNKISYKTGILFDNGKTNQDDNYFAPSTIIPATPNPTAEIHYHYDVILRTKKGLNTFVFSPFNTKFIWEECLVLFSYNVFFALVPS